MRGEISESKKADIAVVGLVDTGNEKETPFRLPKGLLSERDKLKRVHTVVYHTWISKCAREGKFVDFQGYRAPLVLDEMAEATAATTSRENHSLLDEVTKEDYDNFPPKKRSRGIKIVRALRVKLSGCTKYFYDECVWANQQTNCSYFISRTYYQPNSPLAFAVCCSCNEDEWQIGWIKESDKEQFLDFAGNVELKDLNVTCSLMKIQRSTKLLKLK